MPVVFSVEEHARRGRCYSPDHIADRRGTVAACMTVTNALTAAGGNGAARQASSFVGRSLPPTRSERDPRVDAPTAIRVSSTPISAHQEPLGVDIGVAADVTLPTAVSPFESLREGTTIDAWLESEQSASSVLVVFQGPIMVRLVRDLRGHILVYKGPEEPDSLEGFLGRVTVGSTPHSASRSHLLCWL